MADKLIKKVNEEEKNIAGDWQETIIKLMKQGLIEKGIESDAAKEQVIQQVQQESEKYFRKLIALGEEWVSKKLRKK